MDKILLRYSNLPQNLAKDFEAIALDDEDTTQYPEEYPAYLNEKLFGATAANYVKRFGAADVFGIDFSNYYLSAMADRSSASSFQKKGKVCFIYNVGKEPVENKNLASSLLQYLVTQLIDKGIAVIIVSEELSGSIQRTYGIDIKGRVR